MKYVCVVCGREFEKDRGHHKYCSDECREKGARIIRKQWETDTDYTERQRIAAAKRREDRKPKAKPKKLREKRVAVVKDGIADRLLAARLKGDHREYWQVYQRYEIDTAERQGHFSRCKVNGISVYHPQFVELVLDSIEREKRISIINERGR